MLLWPLFSSLNRQAPINAINNTKRPFFKLYTSHHVITHIEAFHADKKDSQCLPQVLDGLIENLHDHGLQVEQAIADTGYSSGAALEEKKHYRIHPQLWTVQIRAGRIYPSQRRFTLSTLVSSLAVRLHLRQ